GGRFQQGFPNAAARIDIGDGGAQGGAEPQGHFGHIGFRRRDGGFDLRAGFARQNGGNAAGGNADAQGAAIDDGRDVKVGQVGEVDHVQRCARGAGQFGTAFGQFTVGKGHDNQ